MDKNKYFKLFISCIPVKGIKRSIIIDAQRHKYYFIPNAIYDILNNYKNYKICTIYKIYKKHTELLNSYFEFLLKNEIIFLTDIPKNFIDPKINNYENNSSLISNAVIEVNSIKPLNKIISQLNNVNCYAIQIINNKLNTTELKEGLILFNQSKARYIELLSIYDRLFTKKFLIECAIENPRLQRIKIFNAPKNNISYLNNKFKFIQVEYNCQALAYCQVNNKLQFNINYLSVKEAQYHNSCLYKKVAIDKNGYIKNCLSFNEIYGNIEKDKLIDIVNKENFKKYWNLNKDKIQKCSDCEFRYVCFDCRFFIEDKKNIYSKPINCNYNPYI